MYSNYEPMDLHSKMFYHEGSFHSGNLVYSRKRLGDRKNFPLYFGYELMGYTRKFLQSKSTPHSKYSPNCSCFIEFVRISKMYFASFG